MKRNISSHLEKICFPRHGPLPNNSKRFQRMGPTPSLVWERWRRFPILGIARVVRPLSALMAPGGSNFFFSDRIPFAGSGVGEAARIGIFLPPGPRRARPTQTVFHPVRQLPNHLLFPCLFPTFGINLPCFLDSGSIRRPSGRGKQRDSASKENA